MNDSTPALRGLLGDAERKDSVAQNEGQGPISGPIQVPFAPIEAEKMPVPIGSNNVYKRDTRTNSTGGQVNALGT